MLVENTVKETNLPLPLVNRGKVRDIYAVGDDKLLIVTTDRVSAFDSILPNPIPDKGRILNQISIFWFNKFHQLVPNHLITDQISEMGLGTSIEKKFSAQLQGRSVLVKKTQPLAIEAVARGYITGSGWKDYLKTGKVCGHALPKGLKQCEQLPRTLFTPATKATQGHDINISTQEAAKIVGKDIADQVERLTIQIYEEGRAYAKKRGIIIADTKFEFGILKGKLILIDEVLTPDSSRFWPADQYATGRDQVSFDKQIIRNYLEESGWDKEPPAPELPQAVVDKASRAYQEIFDKLTK
jgi:phosphoribosylaminoimidazole-succinocarboxamide synthase